MLQMTRQQYQQKYGTAPSVSQPSSTPQVSAQPIQMTRAQYEQKYGKKTLGGFAGNVLKSGGRLIGDTLGAVANVFNPNMEKNTLANIAKLSTGLVQKLDPTQGNQLAGRVPGIGLVQKYAGDQEAVANNIGQFYKDRYGGVENIKNTLYNDPVGAVADVATLATGVGGALRGGGAVASKLGSVSKASQLTKAGKIASNIGYKIDPIMGAGRGVGEAVGAVGSKVRPTLFSRAENMITAGIGNPAQQAKMAQKGGRSVSSFIDEYNLFDRSPETAGQLVKDIGEKFDASAMSTNKSIQVSQMVKAFDDEIAKLSEGTGGQIADATAQKIAELQRRRQMFLDSIVQKSDIDIPQRQLTPDPTEALKVEARKYKSAEEFVAQYKGSGTQYGKYDPSMRMGGTPGSKRLPELGIDPNKEITIYRGIDDATGKVPRKIQDGDFVTTDYETARAYTGSDKDVVSIKVKAKDLFADDPVEFASEPFYRGSEYIYSTKNASTKDLTKSQLTDIYNQSQVKPQLNFTRTQAQSSPLNIPLKQATEFRRKVIDPDVPPSMYGLNPKDAGKAGGVKEARNIFRRESIKVAPELKKLGLDYGMAEELENILKKSSIRKSNRQLFNFTKMGGGGLGGIVAGAPGVVAGFAIEQIVNNPTFIKLASTGLKKALNAKLPQNALTKAGGKVMGGLYQTGRFGRLTSNQTQPISANTPVQPMLQSTYPNYTPKSDLLDEIAKKQGLNVEEMRKKRLNFQRK